MPTLQISTNHKTADHVFGLFTENPQSGWELPKRVSRLTDAEPEKPPPIM
jgi:hypothetical protein